MPTRVATGPETPNPVVSRRRAIQLGAAAGATLIASTAGVGSVMAEESVNWHGDIAPDLHLSATVEIDDHDRGQTDAPLGYLDDSAEQSNLADEGARVVEEADDPDDPHNPFQLNVTQMNASGFYVWPRDETYEDADDEEQDVVWYSEDYYALDAEITLSEDDNDVDGHILNVASDGVATDAMATATMDNEQTDIDADFDERNYFSIILDVNTLPTDAEIQFVLRDEAGDDVTLYIDDDRDAADDDVIATETGVHTYQVRLEDLPGSGDVDEIDSFHIEFHDNDADIDIYALDIGRPSRWDFGTEEFTDEDGDLDEDTVYEPDGETYSITHVGTLGSTFDEARFADYQVEITYHVGDLPAGQTATRFDDFEDSTFFDRSFETLVEFAPVVGIDVSYHDMELRDEQHLEDSHYNRIEYVTDEEDITFEDYDDEEVDGWISRTDEYSDQGETITLDSAINADEPTTVYVKMGITAEQEDEMTSAPAVGPVDEPDDGILGMLFSIPGVIVSSVVAFLGLRQMGWLGGGEG